jgi:hypothetical protein
LAFSVWAKVDDKTLNKLLYEDHQITNNEWNNGGNIKFVTLKRHTPDKFDQFLEDNFLTGTAISMTFCMKITYYCACWVIFKKMKTFHFQRII